MRESEKRQPKGEEMLAVVNFLRIIWPLWPVILFWFGWGIAGVQFFAAETENNLQKRLSLLVFVLIMLLAGVMILGRPVLCLLPEQVINFLGQAAEQLLRIQPAMVVPKLIFYASLLIVGIYDVLEYNIPRFCSVVPLAWIGLRAFAPSCDGLWWGEALASASFMFVLFYLLARGYAKIAGREALGEGDVELVAMIASFCGLEHTSQIITLAALLGVSLGVVLRLFGNKVDRLAFGALLAFALLSVNFLITLS